jgi:hypothetical protein
MTGCAVRASIRRQSDARAHLATSLGGTGSLVLADNDEGPFAQYSNPAHASAALRSFNFAA